MNEVYPALQVPEGTMVQRKYDIYRRGCRWRVLHSIQTRWPKYRLESIGSSVVLYVDECELLKTYKIALGIDESAESIEPKGLAFNG